MSKLSKILIILILLTFLLFGRALINNKDFYQGDIAVPIKLDIQDENTIKHNGKEGEVQLLARAEYELLGIVKSKKKYSDFPSQISEYDLAIAWGDLNKEDLKEVKKINEGDYIKLKGVLVDVDFNNANYSSLWKTSRTRNDTGNGACEILYLEEVTIIE